MPSTRRHGGPIPYLRRAEALQEEKRFDEALADFDRAIERAPAWGEAYHSPRTGFTTGVSDSSQALADLDRASVLGAGQRRLRRDGRTRHSSRDRVDARLGLGRRDEEALALLDAALLDRPDWNIAQMHKVYSLIRLGRLEEALEAANAGIVASEKGGDLPIFVALAVRTPCTRLVAEGGRDCEQAGADIETAERMLQGTFWEQYVLAHVARLHVNRFREFCPTLYDAAVAVEQARAAFAQNPDDDDAQLSLGYALYRVGEFAEALEVLGRLDEEHEFDAAGHLFYLAMTNWKLGRRAEARRVYDAAVTRLATTFPEFPGWRRLEREAAAMMGITG